MSRHEHQDPDYSPGSSRSPSPARSDRSKSSTPFLRSTCHHQGPCHEGHGIEFHSRITPSPARSYHRRRRRSSLRSSTDSPLAANNSRNDISVDDESPTNIIRRNLSAQFEAESAASTSHATSSVRTRRWVEQHNENLNIENQILRTSLRSEKVESRTTSTTQRISNASERKREELMSARPDRSGSSPNSSSSWSSGSPRLKAFEGRSWVRSPRTGYTYVNGPTYRETWTPNREIPMPHMARLPLDSYDDGEVSYRLSKAVRRKLFESRFAHRREEFSDNEVDDSEFNETREEKHFSYIGIVISTLMSLVLFPPWLIFEFCRKVVQISSKALHALSSYMSFHSSNICRRWQRVKSDYLSFMSTNEKVVENEADLFTDDEEDISRVTIGGNKNEKHSYFFTTVFVSIAHFFSSKVKTAFCRNEEEMQDSWIEVIIIRRIKKIYRFFTSTIFPRADKPVPSETSAASTTATTATTPVHDSSSNNNSLPVDSASMPVSNNNSGQQVPLTVQMEQQQKQHFSSNSESTNLRSGENQILQKSGSLSLFRPVAWAVSFLSHQRFKLQRSRWRRRAKRYGGLPTRYSLRLKGLPAENVGDLPTTIRHRRPPQRPRQVQQEIIVEEPHTSTAVTSGEVTEEVDLIDEDDLEQPESLIESVLFHVFNFFGYFDDEDDMEVDSNDELDTMEDASTSHFLIRLSKRIFKIFRRIFTALFALICFPLSLIPSLPPRKKSRQYRTGSRSSRRLRGIPAENSGFIPEVRHRRRKTVDESTFSDEEDEFVVDDYEEELVETFTQRCFNALLDSCGYFQYDENPEVELQDDQQEPTLKLEEDNEINWQSRFLGFTFLPFKLIWNGLSELKSSLLPSRDYRWRKSKDGKYFRVGSRQSLRLRGLPAEEFAEVTVGKRRRRTSRNVSFIPSADDGAGPVEDQPVIVQEESYSRIAYYKFLNSLGYFRQLEGHADDSHVLDEVDETTSSDLAAEAENLDATVGDQAASRSIMNPMTFIRTSATWICSRVTSCVSSLTSFVSLPPRDYQWRTVQRDGKIFRVGWRKSSRLRGLPPDHGGLQPESRKRQPRSAPKAHGDELQDEDYIVEVEVIGVYRKIVIKILNMFNYFDDLECLTEIEGEETMVEDEDEASSQESKLWSTLSWPWVALWSNAKSAVSYIISVFTLPPRDLQLTKVIRDGKVYHVGSRRSARLLGLQADNLNLSGTTRSRRKRLVSDPEAVENVEPEEIISQRQRIFIKILNWFGYFDQLEGPDDEQLEESPQPEIEEIKDSKLMSVVTSAILSSCVLLKSSMAKVVRPLSLPSRDFQWRQVSRDGKTYRIGSRRSSRLQGMSPDHDGLASGNRRRRRQLDMDETDEEVEEVISFFRQVVISTLNWFGYFHQLEASSADDEEEMTASKSSLLKRSLFEADIPTSPRESVLLESTPRSEADQTSTIESWFHPWISWFSFPFKWMSNKMSTFYHRLRPLEDHAVVGPSPSLANRPKKKANRSTIVETEVKVGFVEKFLSYFVDNDVNSPSDHRRNIVEIPNDSLTDERIQHETNGSGSFVRRKFTNVVTSGNVDDDLQNRRKKFCCLILPFLFLLLPILIMTACSFNANNQFCETSSQALQTVRQHELTQSALSVFKLTMDKMYHFSTETITSCLKYGSSALSEVGIFISQSGQDCFSWTSSQFVEVIQKLSSWSSFSRTEDQQQQDNSMITEQVNSLVAIANFAMDSIFTGFTAIFSFLLQLLLIVFRLCLWIVFWIWFGIARFSMVMVSSGPWITGQSGGLESDLVVSSILENSQFRDFIVGQSSQDKTQLFGEKLELLLRDFVARLEAEKSSIELSLKQNEDGLAGLRQELIHRLNQLKDDQDHLAELLFKHETSTGSHDLETQLSHLKLELKKFGQTSSTDDESARALELRLSELQARIEELENELSVLKVESKRCCKNETYIRELLTSQLEGWLNATALHMNTSALVLRDDLEATLQRLADDLRRDITAKTTETVRQLTQAESEKTIELILSDVVTRLSSKNITSGPNQDATSSSLARDEIEKLVKNALVIYDADKTGLFDFALETAGGAVVSTRCTESYVRTLASYTLFGIPIWWPSNNPRTAIQPGVHPGECWAFKGAQGHLVIQMSSPMIPTRFSLEHIPKSMSPNGRIDSAPKDFTILGFENTDQDPEPIHLGRFTYDENGDPIQFFDVTPPTERIFKFVELNILSNYGNINYTCLYRFRVHGTR